jgi:hypothetical protein
MVEKYETKDSGKRQEYDSGMHRDSQENKPRFDLLIPEDMKYDDTLLYRWAMLMDRGAGKYGNRNWELADSKVELDRFKQSAFRHFMQWISGEEDEDHAAAVFFNVNAVELLKLKLKE